MTDKTTEILKTEFSEPFVKGMRERMVVSFYKYGPLADAYPSKVNAVESLIQRLQKYRETLNTEYLIDAANFAMIEFMHPREEGAYFKGTDDDGSPGRIARNGTVDKRNNDEIGLKHVSPLRQFRD